MNITFKDVVSAAVFGPIILASLSLGFCGCEDRSIRSASGTKMATVGTLNMDADGHTAEQRNIIQKIKLENDLDVVWHLYVISPNGVNPETGQGLILKSTVKGKVTSSGKRLTPKKLSDDSMGMTFPVGEVTYRTDEMPGEDGTFGDSAEYIYWTDVEGRNHRHYLLDGQIVHLVDKEMQTSDFTGGLR